METANCDFQGIAWMNQIVFGESKTIQGKERSQSTFSLGRGYRGVGCNER